MACVLLGAFIPYVVNRNKSVALHQRVFTPDWFRYEIALVLNKVGIKMEGERKAEYEKGANVDLMAIDGPDERANQANLLTARQSPGYLLVKELIADMVDRRADRAMLDYTQQSVVSRQLIDGFWHNGKASDRESGDVMLAVMKVLSNLDMAERRKKQDREVRREVQRSQVRLPDRQPGRQDGRARGARLAGRPAGRRSNTTKNWGCGRSSPSNGAS